MAGRGPQSFQKRQKEQQRKEKQQLKMAKRLQRKHEKGLPSIEPFEDPFSSEDTLARQESEPEQQSRQA